jgi:hypothetical protein
MIVLLLSVQMNTMLLLIEYSGQTLGSIAPQWICLLFFAVLRVRFTMYLISLGLFHKSVGRL